MSENTTNLPSDKTFQINASRQASESGFEPL